ncbi:MAG: helix-turn-helix transcriptional regulator [Oscillospiraceae bacterium]|nr:helix-turn-helix transcriptional regulator [Oscillospiraceae bacterium]
MDIIKIGKFLKELRKEKGWTQEMLGEKIGVTNKTVSRWETGTYMPPVECLALLSDLYGVSINEIVAGQRLNENEFSDAAEENLSGALRLTECTYRQTEKRLTLVMIASTLIAMLLLILIPIRQIGFVRSLLLIVLILALAFLCNTLNIVALVQNKEKYGGKDS